jgi:hypothetical protein
VAAAVDLRVVLEDHDLGLEVELLRLTVDREARDARARQLRDAPLEWQAGNTQLVLDYVAGDCTLTNQVVAAIEKAGMVKWRTKRGTLSSEPLPKLRQVRDVMRDPPPDQSWMSEPKPVSNYWAWMKRPATGQMSFIES